MKKYIIIDHSNDGVVFNSDGVKNRSLNIKHDKNGIWTKEALESNGYSLECTGEGYLFTDHFTGEEIFLDYAQANIFRMMYRVIEGKCTFRSYKEI
jgi:hypothetical protein